MSNLPDDVCGAAAHLVSLFVHKHGLLITAATLAYFLLPYSINEELEGIGKEMRRFQKETRNSFGDLDRKLQNRLDQLDQKLDRLNEKMDDSLKRMEKKLSGLPNTQETLRASLGAKSDRLFYFEKKVNSIGVQTTDE